MDSFRIASPPDLAIALQDARETTLALFDCHAAADFDAQEKAPLVPGLDPPLWTLGHIAWFAERHVLRDGEQAPLLSRGDEWFDPARLAPMLRWKLELQSPGALKTYAHEVLDRVLDKLSREENDDAALYPYRLALAHEDLRGEAFAAALQTLNLSGLPHLALHATPTWSQGDIRFPGGTILLGSRRDAGFVFDNEKWAHECHVPGFTMDSTLISNAQYGEFVADGGYQHAQFWTQAGCAWLMAQDRSAPRDWLPEGRRWMCLRFGRQVSLPPHEPVRHLSLYEAQAYCAWAERRLPTEMEWEYAALSGHPAFRWGDLREWTCSPFEPYPGFAADAWHDYSEPHFATHQTVRGASFATPARMRSPKFRGFALPECDEMFAGFRTCAL